jgi:hypothetical protein
MVGTHSPSMKPNELTMMNFHHGQQASAVGSDVENQFWCDGCCDQFKSVVVFEIVLVDTIDTTVAVVSTAGTAVVSSKPVITSATTFSNTIINTVIINDNFIRPATFG